MEISKTDYQEFNRQILQTIVDNMSMEEIISTLSTYEGMSALCKSLSEENILFQEVLTNEYNKRKKQ